MRRPGKQITTMTLGNVFVLSTRPLCSGLGLSTPLPGTESTRPLCSVLGLSTINTTSSRSEERKTGASDWSEPRERNQPSTKPCGVSNVPSFSVPRPKSDRLNLNNQAPINDLRIKSASNVTSRSFLFMGHYGTFDTTSGAPQRLSTLNSNNTTLRAAQKHKLGYERFFFSPKNLS
jgi:hypothetical protein